jgi:hypothetical protein
MTTDQAEYLAGYQAGTNAAPIRLFYSNHEPHYARGLTAGMVALCFGVHLA